ncbi:HD domain-containing protein [Desulfosporosinus sp. Sb-LF]|uniref:HD domain-containing protein n=1 Tax=Desulfosporosinus sp. Sb-LF TaxID=2560027 RepID=UPI00107F70CA|nr:HD domain-containing protein [Desulfosporosinus sp. Sb-LF]TGE32270.1 HDIG domain-containing protein [Desulfosporosinus sp. Sb-LF]
MFYRVRQFIQAFHPQIDSSKITWALNYLSPEATTLFLKQSKTEQLHAIEVTQSIIMAEHPLAYSDFQSLITAALLHDCGKSIISIRLWHRVYIVLMQKMPVSLWTRLEQGHTILASPLKMATQHALWGERLAQKAGLDPKVCRLIREHHSPQTDLGRILEQADNAH